MRRHRVHTLFPYTTLFRSGSGRVQKVRKSRSAARGARRGGPPARTRRRITRARFPRNGSSSSSMRASSPRGSPRSEEHTSELQSHVNIVCRLLLEKKKKRV